MAEVMAEFSGQGRGMNSAANPLLLAPEQYAAGVNVVVRGNFLRTRPGLVEQAVTIPSGTFQGAGVWSLESGDRIVFVVSGIIYVLAVETMALTTIGLLRDPFNQCNIYPVSRYLLVHDGMTTPTVLEDVAGVPQVTASPVGIPAGYAGVYAHGRLHMVPTIVPNTTHSGRDSLVSGDIQLPSDPPSVLLYTENEYLNEGGAHAMPAEMGFIGPVGVFRNAATGTGNGEVVAIARNGACAFDFSLSRDISWKAMTLSKVLFFGAGSRSPWGITNINDDLVYRGLDGLRVVRYTASQISGASGSLSNVPMSLEISRFLVGDGPYLPRVSLAHADNRLLMTAHGSGTNEFDGLISWDLAAGFYNGTPGVGVFDGIWTGDHFLQVVTALRSGVPTQFVFARGPILYRVDHSSAVDVSTSGGVSPIKSIVETKTIPFTGMNVMKQLSYVELYLGNIQRDTDVEVLYRPHGYPLWTSLGSRTVLVGEGSLPQRRRRVRLALDPSANSCDTSTGEPLYTAPAFQFAIVLTGHATIEWFITSANTVGEAPPGTCSDVESTVLAAGEQTGSTLDLFDYWIRGS